MKGIVVAMSQRVGRERVGSAGECRILRRPFRRCVEILYGCWVSACLTWLWRGVCLWAADRVKDGDMLFAEDTPSARVPEKRSSGHQRVAAGLYLLWFTSLAVLGSRSALFPFLGAGDHDVVISAVAATTTAVFYGMNTVIPIVTRLVWRGYDDLDEAKLKKGVCREARVQGSVVLI